MKVIAETIDMNVITCRKAIDQENRQNPWECPALEENMEEEDALKIWRNNSQRGRVN